jgi:hypothetical protein
MPSQTSPTTWGTLSTTIPTGKAISTVEMGKYGNRPSLPRISWISVV